MIRRKYKSVIDVKTTIFSNASTTAASENQETERNAMAGNQESEQIDGEVIQEHIEKSFFSSVSNSTRRRNPLHICRIANPVDYEAQNFIFHQTRSASSIFTLGQILGVYEQLPHVQFPSTFVQFTLPEVIDRANRSELNEIEWKYKSFSPSEDFSESEGSISIPSSSDFCQLFGLRVKTRSSSIFSNATIQAFKSTTAV